MIFICIFAETQESARMPDLSVNLTSFFSHFLCTAFIKSKAMVDRDNFINVGHLFSKFLKNH